MLLTIQEKLADSPSARTAAAAGVFARGRMHRRAGRLYRGLNDVCWVARVAPHGRLKRAAEREVLATIERLRNEPVNSLVTSYLADQASRDCASIFSWSGRGSADMFRDLIVLKAASEHEKGVILLKYARTFSAAMAMLDMPRLMRRYSFVLEPCWAGYCDPSLLMYVTPLHPVFVQCFTAEDRRFVERIGAPFVPLKLGPADWVDADLFTPGTAEKVYDLVMVANWGRHKRHAELFRALKQIRGRRFRVLLIGFPWAGRVADDVRREAALSTDDGIDLEIIESLPASQVAGYLNRSRAFVFLSRKEGDNKALVEAMFANVPALVFEHSIGGATGRINPKTGLLSSDEQLPRKIVEILDRVEEFTPRAWALANSGSRIATRVLDEALRAAAQRSGEPYSHSIVEKTNAPNLGYKDPAFRSRFAADYEFILSCRFTSLQAAEPVSARTG